ncbi:MAG: hypothetical protein ACREJ3_03000, partial [Polyangiaceae bacterium]
ALPVPGNDFADTRQLGYGFALPFVIAPLAAISLVVALFAAVTGARSPVRSNDASRGAVWNLLVITAFMVFCAKITPALWAARYNIELVAGCAYLVHWCAGYIGATRANDAAATFAVLSHAVSLYWASPGYGIDLTKAKMLEHMPPAERATHYPMSWAMTPEAAAARDRELGPGARIAFMDDMIFPGLLWNADYSNIAVYIPRDPSTDVMLRRFDASGATWVVVQEGSGIAHALDAKGGRWESVGRFDNGCCDTAFRRKRH